MEAVSLERLASTGQRLSYYRFRHALLQRSAYGSLDAVERAQLHEATGRALEAIYAAEGEKPQVAQRWRGTMRQRACAWQPPAPCTSRSPGDAAVGLSPGARPVRPRVGPAGGRAAVAQRMEIERLLEAARLGPKRNLAGSGGAELAGALARAGEAGAGEAQGRPRLQMLLSEGHACLREGNSRRPGSWQQMLDLATQWGDEAFVGIAHWRFGFISTPDGQAAGSRKPFRMAPGLADTRVAGRADCGGRLGLMSHALSFSALNQWFLGYPEQALMRSNQAVTGEFEQRDLYGQAFASAIGCSLLFLLRSDPAALQERSELCNRLCQQQGFAMWQPYAEVFLGWLAVLQRGGSRWHRADAARVAGWQAMGMAIGMDSLVMVLADGCLAAARRRQPADDDGRSSLLATALAAIEPLLGPEVPCGQSYQPELHA